MISVKMLLKNLHSAILKELYAANINIDKFTKKCNNIKATLFAT